MRPFFEIGVCVQCLLSWGGENIESCRDCRDCTVADDLCEMQESAKLKVTLLAISLQGTKWHWQVWYFTNSVITLSTSPSVTQFQAFMSMCKIAVMNVKLLDC